MILRGMKTAAILFFALACAPVARASGGKVKAVLHVEGMIGGCDKHCTYQAQILKILKNDTMIKLSTGMAVDVSVVSWSPKPPAKPFVGDLIPYGTFKNMWWLEQKSKTPAWGDADLSGDCAERGGSWRAVCRHLDCVLAFTDAGKKCADGSQCAGRQCVFEPRHGEPIPRDGTQAEGVCRRDDDPCGCLTSVVDGKIQSMMQVVNGKTQRACPN